MITRALVCVLEGRPFVVHSLTGGSASTPGLCADLASQGDM